MFSKKTGMVLGLILLLKTTENAEWHILKHLKVDKKTRNNCANLLIVPIIVPGV